MKDSIKITSRISDWTVIQQKDGYGQLQLKGIFTISEEDNYPVVKVVDIRTEKVVYYEKMEIEKTACAANLSLPVGMYRIETGIALKSSDYNPIYLGYGDILRNIFVGENFIIAGQSNAQGHGREEIKDTPLFGVSMYNGGWHIAAHPLGHIDGASNLDYLNSGHSAWINLGKLILRKTATPVGLIPTALNGSSMDMWEENKELFNRLIDLLEKTSAQGLIWYQGCSDVFIDKPDSYEDKLNNFINALKRRFEKLDIYIVQISGTTNTNNPDIGWRKIREIQRRTAIRHQAHLIVTYDLTYYSDDIHIGSKDNITLSERLFNSYLKNLRAKDISVERKGNDIALEFKGYAELLEESIMNIALYNSAQREIPYKATKDKNKIRIIAQDEVSFISLPFGRLYQGRTLADIEGNPIEYFYIESRCSNAL